MSLYFNGAETCQLASGVLVTSAPLTMILWAKCLQNTGDSYDLCIRSPTGSDGFELRHRGNTAGDPIRASQTGAGTQASTTSNGYYANQWHCLGGVYVSNASRFAWLDGQVGAEGTVSVSMTNARDRIILGSNWASSATSAYFFGFLAHAAIWDTNLINGEMIALAHGANPLTIRPGNLKHYFPLRDNVVDVRTGLKLSSLTGAGIKMSSQEPRIVRQ